MDIQRHRKFLPLALALSVLISGNTLANEVLKPNTSVKTLSQHSVEELLQQAEKYYRSPARISTPGAASKLPDNLQKVVDNLQAAIQLAPWRADLLFSQASAYIQLGQMDNALETYRRILTIAPQDIDALTYLAAWEHEQENVAAFSKYLNQLQALSSERAASLNRLLTTINQITRKPLTSTLPADKIRQEKTAIVTLGYALEPDGSMNPVLIERLQKTLQLANQFPQAILVVSGGVPKNNQTEAKRMAEWLIQQGIDQKRIFQDNAAKTSVENALYSRYILAQERIKHAIIVTSPGHLRRGLTLFTLASKDTGPKDIHYTGIAAPDLDLESFQKVTDKEKLFLYRDALKVIGLWSFRSPPLEER